MTAVVAFVLWVGLTAAWNTRQVQHRMKCCGNLTIIGKAIAAYRTRHPDRTVTLDLLLQDGLIGPGELTCPAARHEPSNYRLAPAPRPDDSNPAIIFEPLSNHRSGANVVFADGKCKFVPEKQFEELKLAGP